MAGVYHYEGLFFLLSSVSLKYPSSVLTAVDYSRLEGFLKARRWKDADQETHNLMLKAMNREKAGYLDADSIQNFPCKVLSQIDRLWLDNSGGKFGFSVQKKIYLENCGGKSALSYDGKAFGCFLDAVGWQVNDQRVSNQMIF